MRTTFRFDDSLLRRAKAEAARRGTSLTAMVSEAITMYLARTAESRPVTDLPRSGRGGLQPGVDLDDSADLLDVMED